MSKGSWDPLGAARVPKPPMGSPVLAISSMWINIVKRFIEIASNLDSDMDTAPSKKHNPLDILKIVANNSWPGNDVSNARVYNSNWSEYTWFREE